MASPIIIITPPPPPEKPVGGVSTLSSSSILIDELDGKLRNLWKFTSVWFSTFALACGTSLAAYAAGKALGLEVVAHVPQWLLTGLIYGSMAGSFGSIIARGIPQPKLRQPMGDDDNAEHA